MLAKKNRLTGSKNFEKVEKEGKIFQSDNFGIAILGRGDQEPSRFAFVVSTKIAKNASDRNTIKRRMRESLRLMVSDIRDGLDVVFLAKTSIVRASSDAVMREVRQSVRASGILK